MIVKRGIIHAYDATTHTAAVQLFGSMSRILLAVPVARHLTAPILETGAACAVAFFAEGSQGLIFATFDAAPQDTTRGRNDDFFGKALAPDQYTPVSNGAGSGGTLAYATHGLPRGVYRLTAGAGVGFYHLLWLGDAANTYPTLDADDGWVMTARMSISATTSMFGMVGARDAAYSNAIDCGLKTDSIADNWIIRTRTAAGAINIVDSGVAADTNPHSHALRVYPIAGGLRQVDYSLDQLVIATTTVAVPTAALTPYIIGYAIAAASRYVDLDHWAIMPTNLA